MRTARCTANPAKYSLVLWLMPMVMSLGGEGLVLRFEGEGKVWLQTRELPLLASALSPHLPERS